MKNVLGIIACSSLLLVSGCGYKRKAIHVESHKSDKHTSKKYAEVAGQPANAMHDEYVFDGTLTDFEELGLLEAAADVLNEDGTLGLAALDNEALDLADIEAVLAWDTESSEEFAPLQFAFDKDMPLPGQEVDVETLKCVADSGEKIVLDAYACNIGNESYNMALTRRRANNVKQMLVKAGVPAESIEAVGRGQEAPLVTTAATTRAQKIKDLAPNRRVEFSTVSLA